MSYTNNGITEKVGIINGIECIAENIYLYKIFIGDAPSPIPFYTVRLGILGQSLTRPYSPVNFSGGVIECIIKIYEEAGDREMFTPQLSKLKEGSEIRVIWYIHKYSIYSTHSITSTNNNSICNKLCNNDSTGYSTNSITSTNYTTVCNKLYDSTEYNTVCMISAGTGITPMLQLLNHNNPTNPNFIFIYVYNSKSQKVPLINHGNITYYDIISHNIQHTDIISNIQDIIRLIINKPVVYLVCGPDSFVHSVGGDRKGAYGGILKEMGVLEKDCYKL
ncbi:hypothetical protein NEPAR08_1101 [Nematocida parisii]|nr:hypothetical protein NEPAR08_1101 [Nematocida parisii]KAI5128367.1 hypothetical protein NEPAR03_1276 [Nematocida parisii]